MLAWTLGFDGEIVTDVTPVDTWTAVPERAIWVGVAEALLTSDTAPVTDPVTVGANFTLKLVLWPGERLSGRANPEMLKPAPLTLPCVMLNVAVPLSVIVTDCDWLLPTLAVKLSLVGLAFS